MWVSWFPFGSSSTCSRRETLGISGIWPDVLLATQPLVSYQWRENKALASSFLFTTGLMMEGALFPSYWLSDISNTYQWITKCRTRTGQCQYWRKQSHTIQGALFPTSILLLPFACTHQSRKPRVGCAAHYSFVTTSVNWVQYSTSDKNTSGKRLTACELLTIPAKHCSTWVWRKLFHEYSKNNSWDQWNTMSITQLTTVKQVTLQQLSHNKINGMYSIVPK